jgi:hypothetical protein
LILAACQAEPLVDEDVIISIPSKTESVKIQDSPITSINVDDYLFREDVFYVDTRQLNQAMEERTIAGFVAYPFYELLANLIDGQTLFKMSKVMDSNNKLLIELGGVGSYLPRFEESEYLLKALFPKDKVIFITSTAGVEATYLANLLIQYGYDPLKIYNIGNFSNDLGSLVAYRNNKNAKYYVPGTNVFTLDYAFDFGELTPLE